jgi:hypothetical protein
MHKGNQLFIPEEKHVGIPARPHAQRANSHRLGKIAAAVALSFGAVTAAHADGSNIDWSNIFSFSGFGTVGMTHSSLTDADYTTTYFEPKGAGHSSEYNFSDDTKVGGQVNAQFTPQLSAVLQVIMQQQYDNSWAPTVEWANVKYAITPDLSVRLGRIELPSFFSSDYRNVGYATPWAHVPVETYNLIPITNSDGVDASYTLHFGKTDNTVQALYGDNGTHVPGPIKVESHQVFGVFDTVERGALTARVGYEQAHTDFGPLPSQDVKFYNAGVDYDPGNWFIQGEWSHAKIGDLTPGYDSWYAIAGYRIQKFTPYAMYSIQHSLGNTTILDNTDRGQKDYSVGVRWDFRKNMDLKFQYDRVVLPANSAGYFINPQQGFALGSSANVVSAVLDFVF